MRRESPLLPQWSTDDLSRARLCASPWTVPFQEHAVVYKTLDGIGQVGEPGATAILAIGAYLQTNVALQLNGLQHCTVLCLTQCIEPEPPLGIGCSRLQKRRWSQ